jgi:hypothetical protein
MPKTLSTDDQEVLKRYYRLYTVGTTPRTCAEVVRRDDLPHPQEIGIDEMRQLLEQHEQKGHHG